MLPIRVRMALHLAGARYKYEAARETEARELLGLSPVRFHALVNAALDDPAALAAEPVVVRRLVRLREARRGVRR